MLHSQRPPSCGHTLFLDVHLQLELEGGQDALVAVQHAVLAMHTPLHRYLPAGPQQCAIS